MITPYHIGPGLFFAKYFNFFAIIIGSVILDLEPFYNLFIRKIYPSHSFFHSFIGGIFGAIIVVFLILPFRARIKKWSDIYMKQSFQVKFLFLSALLGCWLHVLFDSFINTSMKPFWPLSGNPFLGLISIELTYNLALIMAAGGIFNLILSSPLKGKNN